MSEIPGFSSVEQIKVEIHSPTDPTPKTLADSNHALPEPSASSSDPATSLRAAALLTLKSKRRKPAHVDALPTRPVPGGITLNYGDGESSPATPTPDSTIDKSKKATQAGDNREEGEISDSETPPPEVSSAATAAQSNPNILKKTITSNTSPAPVKSLARRPTTPIQQGAVSNSPTTILLDAQPGILQRFPLPPDGSHARPGLAMDQNEYDRSKDIILDLLGWGVEPEYLAGTGLSREVIFYVFTELRLRLPQNLDITGLTPYYPAPPNSEIAPPITTSQPRPLTSSLSNTMPPPAVPPRHDAPRVTHPSLPQKPPGHAPTQLDVPVTVPVVEQERPQATAEANLHDIEQQRKQELIARKAVQASRRNKPPLSATASLDQPPSITDDVLMANVVPTESVDDFLKSIGPMTEMDNDRLPSYSRDTVAYERDHESPEAMEVDDIPGFGDFSSTSSRVDTPPRSASSTGPADADINRSMTGDISSGSDRQHDENVRRGTKRPVASDFVDFEPGPQRSTHASSNGGAQPPSLRRKTTGSFASVSGMRRCVIDLSDSEDDGEGDAHHGESLRGSRQYSPVPTRASIPSGGNGSWNQQQHRSNGHRNQSPAELYAKEEEIKQMKELIAQREQSRLKKLATLSKNALTPTISIPPPTPIKSEEVDSSPLPSLNDGPLHLLNGNAPAPLTVLNGLSCTPVLPLSFELTLAQARLNAEIQARLSPFLTRLWHLRMGGYQHLYLERLPLVLSPSPSPNPLPTDCCAHSLFVLLPIVYIADDTQDANVMENVDTGEQVLTAEARQEPATIPSFVPPSEPANEQVDGDLSPSTQTPISPHGLPTYHPTSEKFPAYDSPFQSFPFLRSRSHQMLSAPDRPQDPSSAIFSSPSIPPSLASSSSITSVSSCASTSSTLPDLKPLKTAVSFKTLDPSKQICQYELPGGGVCRDAGCQDIHLSRVADGDGMNAEPNDEDTAEYIYDNLPAVDVPSSWLTQGRETVVAAIQEELRAWHSTGKTYEERVAATLATLQPPTATFEDNPP